MIKKALFYPLVWLPIKIIILALCLIFLPQMVIYLTIGFTLTYLSGGNDNPRKAFLKRGDKIIVPYVKMFLTNPANKMDAIIVKFKEQDDD